MKKQLTAWNSRIKIKQRFSSQTPKLRRTAMVRKAPKKKKRTRLPSIGTLKRKADLLFSNFIRNRDKWKCVVCGATENIQNGHLIKRGKMGTRYDEDNCHALCSSCNYRDQYEPQHYTNWFIKNYGAPLYDKLYEKSRKLCQMKRRDFNDLILSLLSLQKCPAP